MGLKVVDLDRSLLLQPEVTRALGGRGGALIVAGDLAPRLRFLAGRRSLRALAGRLGPHRRGDIYLYGSGDFHHLSHLLVSRLDQEVSVVHFDNHPDWTCFPRTLGCGSWVSRLLANPQVKRVVTIGPCSSDLSAPQLKSADLPALRSGRLEVFPLASATTFYAGPAFTAAGTQGSTGIAADGLAWRGLDLDDFAAQMEDIAAGLPQTPLWITLDKDVLAPAEAATNWDQGRLGLDRVLQAITIFAGCRRLVGMDVCGDFSPDGGHGALRALLARLDRDQRPPAPDAAAAAALNGATNARILRHMEAILP